MGAIRGILGPSVLILAAFIVRRAEAAEAADVQAAPLTLVVNEDPKGEATVLLRKGDILVEIKDLEDAGLRKLPPTPQETINGRAYVSLAALGSPVTHELDERSLTLRIVAPPQYFGTNIINLRPSAPPNMVQYRDAGLFLNYAPRLVDFRTPAASGEAGLSLGGTLLFSGVSYDPTNGVVRGLSNLTVDEPRELRRWVIGDSFAMSGGPVGGSVFLGGVTIGRAFELDPYYVHFPTFNTTGSASTASTLDVYVNGILVRREPVSAGQFQIRNIPATAGAGTTRYVLRDAFGREQQVVSPFYASASILARGVSDYSLAGGAVRNDLAIRSWSYGRLGMIGRYRIGITDTLTVGFRGEASFDPNTAGDSGGPSLTVLTKIGQVDLGFSASTVRDAGGGLAGYASYAYQSRTFSAGVAARSMSDHYFTLSLGGLDNRALVDGASFVSVPVNSRVALTSNYSLAVSRDTGISGSINVTTSVRLGSWANLYLVGTRTHNSDGTNPIEVFATLSVLLGGTVVGSLSGHLAGTQPDATLDISKPPPVATGYGFHASVNQGQQTALMGSIQGQTQFGQAEAFVSALDKNVHSQLSVAGGIAIVPLAGVFLARPIQAGYGVIQVPGVGNVRGYLNNNEIGRTNGSGNLLVPNLLSYYGNRLSISDKDLPADYRVDGGEHVVATPYRGAAVVRFDVQRVSFVRGLLVVRQGGKDVVPAYGEITVGSGASALASPIARDGEFEFEGLLVGAHSARVEYGEGVCDLTLTIPERVGAVSELGTVVCVVP
jgi:outer membrane usher protein